MLRVAGAQLPVRNDVQKNLEAITRRGGDRPK